VYLTRITIDPRCREARADLGNCHAMHARVMSGFGGVDAGDSPRQAHGVLFVVEPQPDGAVVLLVQSRTMPDWSLLPRRYLRGGPQDLASLRVIPIHEQLDRLVEAPYLRFRLCTNPTKRLSTRAEPGAGRKNGRRVVLKGEVARANWLTRKGLDAGFEVVRAVELVQVEHQTLRGWRSSAPDAPPITLVPVTFSGVLRVLDPARLRAAVERGVGPSKAYGCGLMALWPVAEPARRQVAGRGDVSDGERVSA